MDLNKQRKNTIDMIEKAFKITPDARNAHPWLAPMWAEIQYLRQQLDATPKVEEEMAKTATQILAERKAAREAEALSDADVEELLETKKTTKRSRKAKTDEGQG